MQITRRLQNAYNIAKFYEWSNNCKHISSQAIFSKIMNILQHIGGFQIHEMCLFQIIFKYGVFLSKLEFF